MSDLDMKLRKIFTPAMYALEADECDSMIDRVKQAFIDEGWTIDVYRKHLNDAFIDGIKQEAGLMTGQEWLSRFEKELSDEIYGDTNPTDRVDCGNVPYLCTCDLLEAAKKVAGLA